MERFFRVIFTLLSWLFACIRFVLPYILRAIAATFKIMALGLIALIRGVPTTVKNMSNDWMKRALAHGFPTEYDTILYYATSITAYITLLIGWFFLTLFTAGVLYIVARAIVN